MKREISLMNFFLLLICIVLTFITISFNSDIRELKKEKEILNQNLLEEQEMKLVSELTEKFINKSSVGEHGELLTGSSKKDFLAAVELHRGDSDNHGASTMENASINNIFSFRKGPGEARSYAIYQVTYKNNPNSDSPITKNIISLSLIADWKKTKEGYKVENYKIDVLKDSLDEYLLKLSEEEGE